MNTAFRTFSIIGLLLTFVNFAFAGNTTTSYSNAGCGGGCPSGTTCSVVSNSGNSRIYQCVNTGGYSSSPSSRSSGGSAGGGVCAVQYQRLMAQCQTQLTSTGSNCDEKNNQGMNDATSMASQVALAFGAQAAGSIQAACSSAAALSTAANAALAAYRLQCSSSIKDCDSTCDSVVTYISTTPSCQTDPASYASMLGQAKSARNQCNNYTAKIGEAQQAMTNIAQTAANASQCASLTSADSSSSMDSICAANPSLAGCSTSINDCNNPAMASNQVCICTKNPNDPSCLGTQSVSGESAGLSTIDNSGRLSSTASPSDFTGDEPNLGIQQGTVHPDNGQPAPDGKQGSGVAFGGGSGGSANPTAGGSTGTGGPNDPHGGNVNSGFYGGGGGSGSFGGGSGGGDGHGGGLLGAAANALAAKGGPDLRQFLPGGKMNPGARGIAGATGPDGITGPHTDIWQKVQNRYQVMSPSLLP